MKIEEYAEEVVTFFLKDIAEMVFVSIEHDNESMWKYIENVNRYGQKKVDKIILEKLRERLRPDDGKANGR